MENYPETTSRKLGTLFENDNLELARLGERERWYKSEDGLNEYDGDSLYARISSFDDFQILDGLNLDDVGVFNVYNKLFSKAEINGNKGSIIPYLKIREISGEPMKSNCIVSLNLAIADYVNNTIEKKELIKFPRIKDSLKIPELSYDGNNLSMFIKNFKMSLNFKTPEDLEGVLEETFDLEKLGIKINQNLDNKELFKQYITNQATHLGLDHCYDPEFINENTAVVRYMSESGSTGFDTLYLVQKTDDGIKHKEIINSRETGDYINIIDIREVGSVIKIEHSKGIYEINKDEL